MKKKLNNLFYLLILVFVGFSCSQDDAKVYQYNGNDFIQFKNPNLSVATSEDDGPFEIEVSLSRIRSTETVINLEITDLGGDVEYLPIATTLTIPAGSLSGFIVITPIDDDVNNESSLIRIKIVSSNNDFIIGLREEGTFTKEVTIVNDDCPTKFNLWFGSVNVVDVGFSTIQGSGSGNATGSCDILRVLTNNNLVGWTNGAIPTVPHDFLFIPDFPNSTTGMVNISSTLIGNANFNFGAGAEPGEVLYTITYGEYDETTKIIETDYQVRVRRVSTGVLFNLTGWSGTNRIVKP